MYRKVVSRIRSSLRSVLACAYRKRHLLPRWVLRPLSWLRWRLPHRLATFLPIPDHDREFVEAPQYHVRPTVSDAEFRLFIGPRNFAGQAYEWSRAAEAHLPSVQAVSYSYSIGKDFDFPVDYQLPAVAYRKNRIWQFGHFQYAVQNFSHVIIEAGKPLFADLHRLDPFREAQKLNAAGITVAMLSHGTDSRIPSEHARRFEWSPFHNRSWTEIPRLEREARRFVSRLRRFPGRIFVSTPDLLHNIPHGVWLPLVTDFPRWKRSRPLFSGGLPVVAHAPSKAHVKGSAGADAAIKRLAEAGLLEYKRVKNIPNAEMPGVYGNSDIVLDQFLIGSYGVAAVEAMSAGCVVVGNVTPDVREYVEKTTGLPLPIVQAEPSEIEAVVRELLADPARCREIGASSEEFARTVHDGRLSARVLGEWMSAAGEPA